VTLGAAGVLAAIAGAGAQAPPATEIYLATFAEGPAKTVRVLFLGFQSEGVKAGAPVNISNHPGYDNQPFFLPDSSGVLFSSNRDGQNDIYRYDIATKAITRVTNTAENEYSPTVTPDGRTFTTVRGAEQRLWRFNLDGTDAGLAYAHQGLIGYHAWISPTQLAAFILGAKGSPNTLELIDLPAGRTHVVETSIGRSLHVRPGRGTVSYVHKPRDVEWTIKEVDPSTRETRVVTPAIEGSEDLAWTPAGNIVMGSKSRLFRWTPENQRWIQFADLSDAGIRAITRLAVSPDGKWIAIVSTPAIK
jgi:dipeptidyl aminopeptidase/acylaminoacyl peptidase